MNGKPTQRLMPFACPCTTFRRETTSDFSVRWRCVRCGRMRLPPLADGETREQRCRRVLSGIPTVRRASDLTFTQSAAQRAAAKARQEA